MAQSSQSYGIPDGPLRGLGRLPHVAGSRAARPGGIRLLQVWKFRIRSRAALRRLTPGQLADTGISPAARRHEIGKWFWQG